MKNQSFIAAILLIALLSIKFFAVGPPADGQYTVAVTLSGGSGRAFVESPAMIWIEDGAATAVVTWSSPYYDFMLVDGIQYDPVNSDGNSSFNIPVRLDEELVVSAQTSAMSQPHRVDYILYFDSSTRKPLSKNTNIISPLLCIGGAGIAFLLGVAAVRRKRKQ